jgi:putative membrane protein
MKTTRAWVFAAAWAALTTQVLAADKLTDAQIAHIAYTAGQLDIAAGKQALQKANATEVRAFAQGMVSDHTTVNDQALALVKKLDITPAENATSQALTQEADLNRERIAKLSGAKFDKAYVDNEVAYHEEVNKALKEQLIPGAQNNELKAFLESGLKLFQSHQEHAEHLAHDPAISAR